MMKFIAIFVFCFTYLFAEFILSGDDAERFIIYKKAGLILDTKTNLLWQNDGLLSGGFTYDTASSMCSSYNKYSDDWRLPTFYEVHSLKGNPYLLAEYYQTIDGQLIKTDSSKNIIWTLSEYAADSTNYAWAFDSADAQTIDKKGKSEELSVRCVRLIN